MPVNNFQKGQIVTYKNNGKSVREVVRILHVSLNTFSNFIRKPDINGERKKTRRPKTLMHRDERKLAHELRKSNENIGKAQIKQDLLMCPSKANSIQFHKQIKKWRE